MFRSALDFFLPPACTSIQQIDDEAQRVVHRIESSNFNAAPFVKSRRTVNSLAAELSRPVKVYVREKVSSINADRFRLFRHRSLDSS